MKKTKIRFLASLTSFIVGISVIGSNVTALDINSANSTETEAVESVDNAPVIGTYHYNKYYANLSRKKENEMLLNNNITSYSTYANTTNKRLAIYQVAQEKNFWCGYAAIKSLLNFEKVDMTQEEIAEKVYSKDLSCPWYLSNGDSKDQFPVPNVLQELTGFVYIPYPYGAAGATTLTGDEVSRRVVSTINNGHGVLACGTSKGNISGHASILPGYPASSITHWVAVDGYDNSGDIIYIVDLAKSDVISWSDNISRYYSVSSSKLASFASTRGIVW